MRVTRILFRTLRDTPSEAQAMGHRLLLRAGYVRQVKPGRLAYLPLGRRVLARLEAMIGAGLTALDSEAVLLPVTEAADVDLIVAELARTEIATYRQLPRRLHHLAWLRRESVHAGLGPFRTRAGLLLQGYSLDADERGGEVAFQVYRQFIGDVLHRCDLTFVEAEADVSGRALAFLFPFEAGDETALYCEACGYAALEAVARFRRPDPPDEVPLPMERVATPGTTTIEALTAFLSIPASRTAKAVFLVDDPPDGESRFIFAVVRGDMDVSLSKLAAAVDASALRPATEDEIRAIGAEPGYGSPVGVHDALIVVDETAATSPNLVAGANEAGYHLRYVNYGRDYTAHLVADIAAAREGAPCPHCGMSLRSVTAVQLAHLAHLGDTISHKQQAWYKDERGEYRPILMGRYTLDLERTLAAVAESHHDAHGLIWPRAVAPYALHLVALGGKQPQVTETAERLYDELQAAGVSVLYDDRKASPGVKFNDADLVGLPLRLTVGWRRLKEGVVELKWRDRDERLLVPVDEVVARILRDRQVVGRERM